MEHSWRQLDTTPRYLISAAATLAGMHAQTLRQYDRLGIVSPSRTVGRGRRYSARDIARLRDVQRLSQQEGINLAGIRRILELERQVENLQAQLDMARSGRRVFHAGARGTVISRRGSRPQQVASGALVVYRPQSW